MPADPLILAGLESHGFREAAGEAEPWEPRRFSRLGREDRFLYDDGSIAIEGIGRIPPGSDYHCLLAKCGSIMLRTRERYPPAALQGKLPLEAGERQELLDGVKRVSLLLSADEMLGEITGGSK